MRTRRLWLAYCTECDTFFWTGNLTSVIQIGSWTALRSGRSGWGRERMKGDPRFDHMQ